MQAWIAGSEQGVLLSSKMPLPGTGDKLRQAGYVRGDRWERFDRLQRNLRPFLRGKPKRAPIERFRSYVDMEHGRSDATT